MNRDGISAQIKHLSASLSDFFVFFNWPIILFWAKLVLLVVSALMLLAIIIILIKKSSL